MPTLLALNDLGTRGTSIDGSTEFDQVGLGVSVAGDFNGDGFDDVIIQSNYGGADHRDRAYVVFGGAGGLGTVDLAQLQPSEGFAIRADWGFSSVSNAGDINGDGFDDVAFSWGSSYYSGWGYYSSGPAHAYVIFGRAGGIGPVDLRTFEPSDGSGFVVNESTKGELGQFNVSTAGDVNGDGYADFLIGAPSESNGAGAAYVIFGKASGLGTIDLSDLASSTGVAIKGAALENLGASVASAGDVNGDGYDDLIIGAPRYSTTSTNIGAAYVIFGRNDGFGSIDVANLKPADGFLIVGDIAFDNAGWSVSAAGDVNGDGYDDVILGALYHDDGGDNAGQAYVIFGHAGGFGNINLAALGNAGFSIRGDAAGDNAGFSVAAAGDVNQDGFDDVIVGAPRAGGDGAAYVIFGRSGGFGTIDLTDLSPATGFVLQGGASGDDAGLHVAGGGDINRDGHPDLIVAAPYADVNGSNSGQVYIVSGAGPLARVHNDFNGDGRSDILWRGDNGLIFNWVASGNGSFASNGDNFATTVSADSQVVGTGDFNGDGIADILWRQGSAGALYDWLGGAKGSFVNNSQNFSSAVPSNVQIVGTGDFNGDSRDDILFRSDTGLLFDWLGQANGGFANNTANFATVMGTDWKVLSTGDFNGDGRDDILWQQDGTDRLLDWLGGANGGFSTNAANFDSSVPSSVQFVGTGDFNGDGRDDVLWRGSSGLLFDWLGNGAGGFASNAANFATVLSTDWHVVSIGDFNADGRDDIVWQQNTTGRLLDWLGTANGGFVTNLQNFSSSAPSTLHVTDPFL